MPISFDAAKSGLGTFLKDYQELALMYLWRLDGEGASSHDVWVQVNKDLKGVGSISRASIINFLDAMVDDGVLSHTETTGKGGHRRIYSAKYDEAGFKEHIARVVVRNLLRDFPEETRRGTARSRGFRPSLRG
jgi:hypothetical protein